MNTFHILERCQITSNSHNPILFTTFQLSFPQLLQQSNSFSFSFLAHQILLFYFILFFQPKVIKNLIPFFKKICFLLFVDNPFIVLFFLFVDDNAMWPALLLYFLVFFIPFLFKSPPKKKLFFFFLRAARHSDSTYKKSPIIKKKNAVYYIIKKNAMKNIVEDNFKILVHF